VPLTPAQQVLVAENIRLPHWMARRLTRLCPWNLEDATDAAVDATIRAARNFDLARGCKFTSLASKNIRMAIYSMLKRKAMQRRTAPGTIFSLDSDGLGNAAHPPFEARLFDDEPDFAALIRPLRKRDRMILRWRFHEGLTLDAIGNQLGLTRERVRQIELKALAHLRLLLDRPSNH
jgi:RNA polymerase sigma factor (sigma-70 family)